MRAISGLLALLVVVLTGAQTERAGQFTVIQSPVLYQRADTAQTFQMRVGGVFGVGDTLRTGARGTAQATFPDGAEFSLQPLTQITLAAYTAPADEPHIALEQQNGYTTHTVHMPDGIYRVQQADSETVIQVSSGQFTIRDRPAEQPGTFSVLMQAGDSVLQTSSGTVEVPSGYGVRVSATGGASDSVLAASFRQLDDSLDGCPVSVTVRDNRNLPVYMGPTNDTRGIGLVNPFDVTRVYGQVTDTDWYRVAFAGGYGWVQLHEVRIGSGCSRVRVFPPNHVESANAYTARLDVIGWGYCTGNQTLPPGWGPYTVQAEENIYDLQREYGSTVERIAYSNCIADPAFIVAGDTLYLPGN